VIAMSTPPSEVDYHEREDAHRRDSPLADIILGGQDGLVNVLGVLLGVAGATGDARVVIAAGLATAAAESLSMAAVAYTANIAEGELYESERAREYRHVVRAPTIERDEVRRIYRAKGFDGELLDRIVETITANADVWVAVMMAEEHHRAPIGRRASLRAAIVVGLAAAIGSLVPCAPFFLVPIGAAAWVATAVAAVSLFALGAYKARHTGLSATKSGLELAVIGMAAALAGWAIGAAFHAPAG
jgi:VIT1/CCC1 family predicted Fe2+/Mn2+ transporter